MFHVSFAAAISMGSLGELSQSRGYADFTSLSSDERARPHGIFRIRREAVLIPIS